VEGFAEHAHAACAPGGEKSSNEVHHEALQAAGALQCTVGSYPPALGSCNGHVVVTLFLKGKKKKELLMVVKRPESACGMAKLAGKLSVAGGARFASAGQLMESLGVVQDFVSPLTLANNAGCDVQVVLDSTLQGESQLLVLPPGENTKPWGFSFDEAVKFAQLGGRTASVVAFSGM
jgi:hypothetical protein